MSDVNPVFEYALRLGDDALTLGHRLSEWCSNGPYLEEDIALSNIALDHIGRARMCLGYASELEGNDRDEDELAFMRDTREYRNLLICELPRGDFAFTMMRQFLLDAFQAPYFAALAQSADDTLAGIGGKSAKESAYHLRHCARWVIRLGDGTGESHQRAQSALDALWGYVPEMFVMDELESRLRADDVAVDRAALRDTWRTKVDKILSEATLQAPDDDWNLTGGRQGVHTEHLGHLLADMQFMQRAYPGRQW